MSSILSFLFLLPFLIFVNNTQPVFVHLHHSGFLRVTELFFIGSLTKPFIPSMRLKDYYRVLGIGESASGTEIKKAYRKLALQYHPDRNLGSPFAESNFREIQEAYHLLSNDKSRRKYDQELWLSGARQKAKNDDHNTPYWLLKETTRLRQHMMHIDTYRMDQQKLQQYVLFLLGERQMEILRQENDPKLFGEVAENILEATRKLRPSLLLPVKDRLLLIAASYEWLQRMILEAYEEREKVARWEKRFPLLVVLLLFVIALLVAVIGWIS